MKVCELFESDDFDPVQGPGARDKARYLAARVHQYETMRKKIGRLIPKYIRQHKAIKPGSTYKTVPFLDVNGKWSMEITPETEQYVEMLDNAQKMHDEIMELFMREDMPAVSIEDDQLKSQIESFILDRQRDIRDDATAILADYELYYDDVAEDFIPQQGLFLRGSDYKTLPQSIKAKLVLVYKQDDIRRFTPTEKLNNPKVKRIQDMNAMLNIFKIKFDQLQHQ